MGAQQPAYRRSLFPGAVVRLQHRRRHVLCAGGGLDHPPGGARLLDRPDRPEIALPQRHRLGSVDDAGTCVACVPAAARRRARRHHRTRRPACHDAVLDHAAVRADPGRHAGCGDRLARCGDGHRCRLRRCRSHHAGNRRGADGLPARSGDGADAAGEVDRAASHAGAGYCTAGEAVAVGAGRPAAGADAAPAADHAVDAAEQPARSLVHRDLPVGRDAGDGARRPAGLRFDEVLAVQPLQRADRRSGGPRHAGRALRIAALGARPAAALSDDSGRYHQCIAVAPVHSAPSAA
ncbi:hypothetical protein D3C73_950860 [compost metagenome]